MRIAECTVRNPQFEIRNLAASIPIGLLAVIFYFGLTPAVPAQTSEKKCGLRIADCGTEVDKPTQRVESQTPDSGGQLSILNPNLLDAERQTSTDQHQPIEPKLPAVRCKNVVRWQSTPVSEKDKPDSSSQLAILNTNSLNGSNNSGMPNANSGADNPQSAIRDSKLSSQAPIDSVALALIPNQQQSVDLKLPSVRCKIAPSKDAVRWHSTPITPSAAGTPVAPVSEKDESTQRVESQTDNPQSAIRNSKLSSQASIDPVALAQTVNRQQPVEPKLPSVRCTITPTKDAVRWRGMPTPPGTPVSEKDKSTQRVESQTPDSSRHLAILNASSPNGDNDRGMPNVNCQTSNPQSAIRNPQFNSDGWFQISTETPEPTDIQETVLTRSDGDKAGPQPLAQVLANLARDAERNFVDPGIPADETITYNFADSDLDPWEAFTRIAEARGYRIVYWGDVVTLTRNQQDPFSPVNPHTVKAEIWVWVDQSAKPRDDRRGLVLQLAGADVAPNSKPQTVRSLEAGSKATISFIDAQSERGDSTLRLTVNPVLLPNGNIEVGLGIENAVPALDGHKGVTIRRNINHTLELTPTKQVLEIDGILMPSNDPVAGKRSWIQRLFRSKKAPEKSTARMVVKLTVEPVADSQTPVPTDNPVRIPGSDSGKTGVVLAPGQVRRTPELTSIQTLKH